MVRKKIESYVARVKNKKKEHRGEREERIKITRHDDELYGVVIVASRYTLLFFFQKKCVTHMSCLRIMKTLQPKNYTMGNDGSNVFFDNAAMMQIRRTQ